jgi:hypothetical protein
MATDSPPKLKHLARRLLRHDAALPEANNANDTAVFRVSEKLRGPIGRLMGTGGYRSLLARAQALAGADMPALRTLLIKADGSLEGLDELRAKLDSRAFATGETALVTQLLGLLETFIGRGFTLRLLREIWPKLENLDGPNEETP